LEERYDLAEFGGLDDRRRLRGVRGNEVHATLPAQVRLRQCGQRLRLLCFVFILRQMRLHRW
jgi:hypothetical protein